MVGQTFLSALKQPSEPQRLSAACFERLSFADPTILKWPRYYKLPITGVRATEANTRTGVCSDPKGARRAPSFPCLAQRPPATPAAPATPPTPPSPHPPTTAAAPETPQ